MTKRELIKKLEKFSDDTRIIIASSCGCGNITVEDLSSLNRNGNAVQLNTDSMENRAHEAWTENRQQNGKQP